MIHKLFISSDNLVRWDKMINSADGGYINNAAVTFTLKDSDGETLSGANAVSMPYVGQSDGRYHGTLESTVSLAAGSRYFLEITATRGGLIGFRRLTCTAQYQGAE